MSYLIPASSIPAAERTLRDMATTVLSHVATRRDHPSYGISKTSIRADLERLDGAVGFYMVLLGQATHTSVPNLATFSEAETEDIVRRARQVAKAELASR